jgi:AcrR family transcriptional regulator
MEQVDVDVNPSPHAEAPRTRRYDSSGRRSRAERSRERIVDVARDRFLTDGYAATTIAAIAREARVSTETVHKAFGGKPGLVRAVLATALEGLGPVPAQERSDHLSVTEPDPRTIIRGWTRLAMEVAPAAAPVELLVRDAGVTDPQLAELFDELEHARLVRMTDNARRLAEHGHLRPGLSIDDAAVVMWTYTAPVLYELLVLKRGWSVERFADFTADALTSALLPP